MPNGKQAVFFGWPATNRLSAEGWWVLDLRSGNSQPMPESPPAQVLDWVSSPMAGNPTDGAFLYVETSGDTFRVVSTYLDNWKAKRSLLHLTLAPINLDIGPDGSLYADQVERPAEILRVTNAKAIQRIPLSATYQKPQILPLPGDRFLLQSRVAGQYRVMMITRSRAPERFVQTDQESREPLALLGSDRILCRVGTSSNWVIAMASAADGRILNQFPAIRADHRLTTLAGSPDGRTIYYSADRTVWAVPVEGGEPRKICEGDGIAPDPNGRYLVIHRIRAQANPLVRVSLPDGVEEPISAKYPLTPWPITPNAVRSDGRIAIAVAPADLWFWPAAILDPATGEMDLVPERYADMPTPGWDFEGNLVTSAQNFRASLWRFRPEK